MYSKLIAFFIASVIIFVPSISRASTTSATPGVTPDSPIYFFDTFFEDVQLFFTFNAQDKIKLQTSFAQERLAEIQKLLTDKGVDAKGLTVARERLQKHLNSTSGLVSNEKSDGKDVEKLAEDLDLELEQSHDDFNKAYEIAKLELENELEQLKAQFETAKKAQDMTLVAKLNEEINQVTSKLEALEKSHDSDEAEIEDSKEHFENAASLKYRAQERVKQLEQKLKEITHEASVKNVTLPTSLLENLNSVIARAKSAMLSENYQSALELAINGREIVSSLKDSIQQLAEFEHDRDQLERESDKLELELSKEEDQKLKEDTNEELKKLEEQKRETEKKQEEVKREIEKSKIELEKKEDEQKQEDQKDENESSQDSSEDQSTED